MRAYTINLKGVKTYGGLYEAIISGMGFPEWTGKNPDALWDMLCSDVRTPAVIYLKFFDELPKALDDERKTILKIFNRAHDWYDELGDYLKIDIDS